MSEITEPDQYQNSNDEINDTLATLVDFSENVKWLLRNIEENIAQLQNEGQQTNLKIEACERKFHIISKYMESKQQNKIIELQSINDELTRKIISLERTVEFIYHNQIEMVKTLNNLANGKNNDELEIENFDYDKDIGIHAEDLMSILRIKYLCAERHKDRSTEILYIGSPQTGR